MVSNAFLIKDFENDLIPKIQNKNDKVLDLAPLQFNIDECHLGDPLNVQNVVGGFYTDTINDILGNRNTLPRKHASNIDLTTDADTYRGAVEFVDISTEQMITKDMCNAFI